MSVAEGEKRRNRRGAKKNGGLMMTNNERTEDRGYLLQAGPSGWSKIENPEKISTNQPK